MSSAFADQRRTSTASHLGVLTPSRRRAQCLASLVILWAATAGAASAQDSTEWTNSTLGNWFIAGNWSAGVPFSPVNAFIPRGPR